MTPLKDRLEHWAAWAIGGGTVRGYPPVSAFWRPRVQQSSHSALLVDDLAESVERVVTGGRDKHGNAADDGFCLRVHRTELYLVLLAEYLGVTPEVHPDAWRAAYQKQGKLRWLLDALSKERGVTMSEPHPRGTATLEHYRARQAIKLGLSNRAYERLLADAHVAVGLLLELTERGVLAA